MNYIFYIIMKQRNNNILLLLFLIASICFVKVSSSCGAVNGLQTYLQPNNSCAHTCPSDRFKDNSNFECTLCSNTCNGCHDSATKCNACAENHFRVLGSAFLCTNDCTSGYYGSSATGSCTPCPIGCKLCAQNGANV